MSRRRFSPFGFSQRTSRIVTPTVTVFADEHEAQHHAADLKAASSNGVVFTKEMSWKVNFATDSCRREPFGEVIRTMAQVQPSQGDERVVAAQGSDIVSIAKVRQGGGKAKCC